MSPSTPTRKGTHWPSRGTHWNMRSHMEAMT
jgi:hypothetical protein